MDFGILLTAEEKMLKDNNQPIAFCPENAGRLSGWLGVPGLMGKENIMNVDNLAIAIRTLQDKRKLEQIGSKVVKDSIRRSVLERLDVRDDDVMLVLKKGDLVPASLREESEMKLDSKGLAAADWCKSWCKGGDWGGKCWGKCKGDTLPMEAGFYAKTDFAKLSQGRVIALLVEQKFTPAEIEVLKKNAII